MKINLLTEKNHFYFVLFLYIIFSILIGVFGNTFAFNVDHSFVPLYKANINNIYKNFFYFDYFTGFNFGKIFQTIPALFNFFFVNLDFLINQKQTSSIFLSFYFINYLSFYVYLNKKFTDRKNIILYSILFSTSIVSTCSICLGFTNLSYIIAFFPFLMGWCDNKLENRYSFFYFLLTLGSPAMFVFSVFFCIFFCENLKKRFFHFVKIIIAPIFIFLTYTFLIDNSVIQFAISKNTHQIFLSNRPLFTFFNLGFLDRSNQIILFDYFVFLICFFTISFYLHLIIQIKKKFISFKTTLSFLLFLLIIVYMIVGIIFPQFYNLLYKTVPGLIIFRGQYLFNIFALIFFIYFFLNSKDSFIKSGLIYVMLIFQLFNISLLFFSKNHLDYSFKNFHYTKYNYYKDLNNHLNIKNNNIFFPLVITNNVVELEGNTRNGTGYNYHLGKFNPLKVKEFLEKNSFKKTLENFNFEKIIIVKNDIFLNISEIDFTYLKKIHENKDFIIYENILYENNKVCFKSLNYYKCLDNIFKNQNVSKTHESTNFRQIETFEIVLFHIIQIFLIISFFLFFIQIKILK